MSNVVRPDTEMLADFVSGPVPLGACQDENEALQMHWGESRARLAVLLRACRRLKQADRQTLVQWCYDEAEELEKITPPTSRFTSLDAARRELRSLVEWLVDLD